MVDAPITVALFDLDGTVWDSAPGILDATTYTLAALGLRVPAPEVIRSHLGPPLRQMLAELGVPADSLDDARDLYRSRYREVGEYEAFVFAGMPELLDELRGHGLALGAATSKGDEAARRMLDAFTLAGRFDAIAAAPMDALGDKVAIVRDAVAKLRGAGHDVEPHRAVMIGDRRYDIEAGRRLGFATIAVSWGYAPPGEFERARPDHVAESVAALRALLLGGASSGLSPRG